MSINYNDKELDALIAYLHRIICDVRMHKNVKKEDLSELLRIVEAVENYALYVRHGMDEEEDILQTLISLSKPAGEEKAEEADGIAVEAQEETALVPVAPSAPLALPAAAPVAVSVSVPDPSQEQPAAKPRVKASVVKDSEGRLVHLGKCLGSGGEGSVYKIPSKPGKAAKIFPRDLGEQAEELEKKIELLISKKKAGYIDEMPVASIPEELLYYTDDTFAGYVMTQFATTMKIHDAQRQAQFKRMFPDVDYRGQIVVAYNLAEAVKHLHSHDIIIGDMNYNNILIHEDGTVGLIDCDSFDITDPETGRHFNCKVGLQEMLAPELQNVGRLCDATFTKESDCFPLAIHIFRLLMDNADPFGAYLVGGQSVDTLQRNNAIANGECVYVREVPGKALPRWSAKLDILPEDIQDLFRRTFNYTAETVDESIRNRPTAAEWVNALQKFYAAPMTQCQRDPFHWYLPSLSGCPFCQRNDPAPED